MAHYKDSNTHLFTCGGALLIPQVIGQFNKDKSSDVQ